MKYTFLNQELEFTPGETYKTYIAHLNKNIRLGYYDSEIPDLGFCAFFNITNFAFGYSAYSTISIQDAFNKLELKLLKELKEDIKFLEKIYKDLLKVKEDKK